MEKKKREEEELIILAGRRPSVSMKRRGFAANRVAHSYDVMSQIIDFLPAGQARMQLIGITKCIDAIVLPHIYIGQGCGNPGWYIARAGEALLSLAFDEESEAFPGVEDGDMLEHNKDILFHLERGNCVNLETLHTSEYFTPARFARLQQLCPKLRSTNGPHVRLLNYNIGEPLPPGDHLRFIVSLDMTLCNVDKMFGINFPYNGASETDEIRCAASDSGATRTRPSAILIVLSQRRAYHAQNEAFVSSAYEGGTQRSFLFSPCELYWCAPCVHSLSTPHRGGGGG